MNCEETANDEGLGVKGEVCSNVPNGEATLPELLANDDKMSAEIYRHVFLFDDQGPRGCQQPPQVWELL